MELRAVEESRVDEDDMRAVTCGGEESAEEGDFFKDKEGDFFGWWDLETQTTATRVIFMDLSPLRLHSFTDNAPIVRLRSLPDGGSNRVVRSFQVQLVHCIIELRLSVTLYPQFNVLSLSSPVNSETSRE